MTFASWDTATDGARENGSVSNGAVFLYDGDCGFCTASAMFLRRHVPTPARVVAWQDVDLAPLGVTAEQCRSAVQHVANRRVSAGPVAVADLLRTATGARAIGWRILGRLLRTRPVLLLAWPVYRLVARYRHRLPGGTQACEFPRRAGA